MKPAIPKGTRDFLPAQAARRKYIFKTIEQTFIKFGYQPLETPAMELLETLTGKYGDEGDKLLFKILNSGDYLSEANAEDLQEKNSAKILKSISKKGLRYDLTVPFARVVASYQNEISFPFKRYQIQAVWRADRPQRGRYQEFYQCDADVVGSNSLMYEAELIQIYDQVFHALGIPVKILINHRQILAGLAKHIGAEDKFVSMTVAIDKLDKIGKDGVSNELKNQGFDESSIEKLFHALDQTSFNNLEFNDTSKEGIQQLNKVLQYLNPESLFNSIVYDISLARGLSYYTGCILEVVPTTIKMGSLGGGGRYDNLTGVFGLNGVSGVGVSFGADRIFDVMEELNLFPLDVNIPVKALIMALDEESHLWAFNMMSLWRKEGLSVDLYPEASKLKKQFKYAEDLKIPYAIIIGESERNANILNIKDLTTGEQMSMSPEAIFELLMK